MTVISLGSYDIIVMLGGIMAQVTARIPDDLVRRLEESAKTLRRSRADVIRQAIEYYLDDVEDLRAALEVLQDPADPVLDWNEVRRELLGTDQGERR